MIAMAMPAAIRPYSMAVAPDSSLTKRETRFFIVDNSCVHVAGRTIVWSRRRSQHRDHGVTLKADHCGAVNSIAQKRREPGVLEQSKRGIKAVDKMQQNANRAVWSYSKLTGLWDSRLLKREGIPLRPAITRGRHVSIAY